MSADGTHAITTVAIAYCTCGIDSETPSGTDTLKFLISDIEYGIAVFVYMCHCSINMAVIEWCKRYAAEPELLTWLAKNIDF